MERVCTHVRVEGVLIEVLVCLYFLLHCYLVTLLLYCLVNCCVVALLLSVVAESQLCYANAGLGREADSEHAEYEKEGKTQARSKLNQI